MVLRQRTFRSDQILWEETNQDLSLGSSDPARPPGLLPSPPLLSYEPPPFASLPAQPQLLLSQLLSLCHLSAFDTQTPKRLLESHVFSPTPEVLREGSSLTQGHTAKQGRFRTKTWALAPQFRSTPGVIDHVVE